jgi:rRNA small subunit pseudouridine methyltransferase Nep1
MLTILFVETALELVPGSIVGHPSVVKNARRQGKRPEETLLDRSLHHRAMLRLPMAEKKGRPDIIHFCLLEALGSPLNRKGGLAVWAHTQAGVAIEVAQVEVRRVAPGTEVTLSARLRQSRRGLRPWRSSPHVVVDECVGRVW